MMIKTLATATVLALMPIYAMACTAHDQAKMSCTDGMAYDSASHSCKVVSG